MIQKQETATAKLERDKIGSLLLHYSVPAIVGMVVASLYNIVDRVFIGQGVGPLAISGLALTFPLMTLIAAIGTLVGVGASARLSIVLGMKDIKWARNILGNAFILTFVLSAVFITIAMIYLPEILVAFGGSEQTIPYAIDYLKIVIPGSVLTNVSYSFSGMMRASGYPQKSMYTILIGVVLNVILDPIFIFGFGLGIQGAAIATVISMFVSAVFVMSHFFNPKHVVHFEKGCMHLRGYIIRNITSIGMAPFLMNVAACGVNIIMNHQLVRQGGDLAIGAYGILNSYAILIVMSVMGLCQGMQPIVGYNYGAQKYKRMKDTLLLTLRVGTLIMVIGFVVCELFPGLLVINGCERHSAGIHHAAGGRFPDHHFQFFPVDQQSSQGHFYEFVAPGNFSNSFVVSLLQVVRADRGVVVHSVFRSAGRLSGFDIDFKGKTFFLSFAATAGIVFDPRFHSDSP